MGLWSLKTVFIMKICMLSSLETPPQIVSFQQKYLAQKARNLALKSQIFFLFPKFEIKTMSNSFEFKMFQKRYLLWTCISDISRFSSRSCRKCVEMIDLQFIQHCGVVSYEEIFGKRKNFLETCKYKLNAVHIGDLADSLILHAPPKTHKLIWTYWSIGWDNFYEKMMSPLKESIWSTTSQILIQGIHDDLYML